MGMASFNYVTGKWTHTEIIMLLFEFQTTPPPPRKEKPKQTRDQTPSRLDWLKTLCQFVTNMWSDVDPTIREWAIILLKHESTTDPMGAAPRIPKYPKEGALGYSRDPNMKNINEKLDNHLNDFPWKSLG